MRQILRIVRLAVWGALTSWAAVDEGLVGCWTFDEGRGDLLHDASGQGNDGHIRGAAWVRSGSGYALQFDGADDYVDCGSASSLDLRGPLTLMAWVKPTAANRGEPGIVGKFFESYAITYYGGAHFYISSGGNNVNTPLRLNAWRHVAATFDGTTMRIYADGVETQAKPSKIAAVRPGGRFLMGCIVGDPSASDENLRGTAFFPGQVDHVRLYNRALSANEVAAAYNLDAADKGLAPFDLSQIGRCAVEAFLYPETATAVLAVNSRWALPLPEGAGVVAELAAAGSQSALRRQWINPDAPHHEDEAAFDLAGLAPGDYELRARIQSPDLIIQAEAFARAAPTVQRPDSGWMAGKINLAGGWAEYVIETDAGAYALQVRAARIHDAAGLRCRVDGAEVGTLNLNGPHSGGDGAWAASRWEDVGTVTLTAGEHILRTEVTPATIGTAGPSYALHAYLDAFGLQRQERAPAAEGATSRVSFRWPPEPPSPPPAPSLRTIGPLPPAVQPPAYDLTVSRGGGFTVRTKGREWRVESSYSYPHGGENRLSAEDAGPGGEPNWRVRRRSARGGPGTVEASGDSYRLSRDVVAQPTRILVRDTLTNLTDDVLGIIMDNHIDLRGQAEAEVTRMANPTVFAAAGDCGLGLIALDDLYQCQHHNACEDGRAGVGTRHFGLDKGASYTLEWAVYPTATTDYYDFINQVRRDEGLNRRVEGAFSFVERRTPPTAEFVDYRNLAYASIGCLGQPLDDPAMPLEGFEFVEYPKESAALRATFAETKRLHPRLKVMFHVAHSLYICNDPEARFQDSRALDETGRQLHYGPDSFDYYGNYISRAMFGANWRWWLFYPTPQNRFGKAMLDATDIMLRDIGATGMWADGYFSGYVRGGYSYDGWDGHSVTIDPQTKLVTRKKVCVPYVSRPVLLEVIRRISRAGGVLVSNGEPGSRVFWNEDYITSCETGGGDAQPVSALHLGRSVTPLGNPAVIHNERDFYRDMLAKLELGALFFWYGGSSGHTHRTLTSDMYPITFESIHSGTVRGAERIVTKRSGVYGWPGDRSLHSVRLYDARGALSSHAAFTTADRDSVRTELRLGKDQSAVVVKLPVTLTCRNPANIAVRRYDAGGLAVLLNGKGDARLQVTDGILRVRQGDRFRVSRENSEDTATATADELILSLELNGLTSLRMEPRGAR